MDYRANLQFVLRRFSSIINTPSSPYYGDKERSQLYEALQRDLARSMVDFRAVKGIVSPHEAQAQLRRLYDWFIKHHSGNVADRVAFDAAYAFIEAFLEELMQ